MPNIYNIFRHHNFCMPKGILGAHDSPSYLARLLARCIRSWEAWRTFSEGMVLFFSEFQRSKHQRGEDLFTLAHTGQESPCARRVLHGWRFSPTYFPVPSGKSWSRWKWNIYTIIIPLASFIAAQLWHVFLTDKGSAWPWVRNSTKTVRIRKLESCFIGALW